MKSTAVPTAIAPASLVPLKVGDAAPDVTFQLEDGKQVSLASLKGKDVLVYFYPKDDTPGCTVEAKGIKESWADFEKAGIAVYGVSMQDAASHVAFKEKYGLPFPLVVDTDGKVAAVFHVPVSNGYARRQSFLVDKEGKIKKVWLDVDPSVHAASVLEG